MKRGGADGSDSDAGAIENRKKRTDYELGILTEPILLQEMSSCVKLTVNGLSLTFDP